MKPDYQQDEGTSRSWLRRWTGILSIIGGIITVIAVIWGLWAYMQCPYSQGNTVAEIARKRHLAVGYIPYFELTSREASSGEVHGFLIDACMVFAKKLNLELQERDIEFVEANWDTFAFGLQQNKFQLSIAGTFRTPERARRVAFTRPLFYLGNGALVRTDDTRFHSLTNICELDRPDITIAVVIGEQGHEFALKNLKKARLRELQGPDLTLPCLEVECGRADVALSDQYILSRYVKEHPAVHDLFKRRPYSVFPICWAVRINDTAWLKEVNHVLEELDGEGWLRRAQANFPMIPFAATPTNHE